MSLETLELVRTALVLTNVNMPCLTHLGHLIEIIKSKCCHYLLVSNFIKCLTCIILFDVHKNFMLLVLLIALFCSRGN